MPSPRCSAQLDAGKLRVAEKIGGEWITHQWIKKAVLLSFRLEDNAVVRDGYTNYFDKVPAKFADYGAQDFKAGGFRVVPPAAVRRGAFIGRNVVLMPSYVNIGAYVDEGTMVDTWATVGSCAQIGKNVHLSGGVGIGGVLEPVQANPTIIEDNCFIGARSEIVEGVIVGAGLGHLDGRVHRPEHEDLQPRDRRGPLRPHSARLGGGVGQPALRRRQVQPLLRGHRQAGGRQDPRQDQHQRAAARRLNAAACLCAGQRRAETCFRRPGSVTGAHQRTPMYLTPLLKLMAEKQASDLFISAGMPLCPSRSSARSCRSTRDVLDPETVKKIAYEMMSEKDQQDFEQTWEMNFSFPVPDVGRFRVNVFRQRGQRRAGDPLPAHADTPASRRCGCRRS